MGKFVVMEHPLIKHKLSILRDKNTGVKEFRELAEEIAMLICYEATRDLPLTKTKIETPVTGGEFETLENPKIALVPILRAGIGMTGAMLALMPTAKVGHVGIYRDPETLEPVEYYCKLPSEIAEMEVFVIDPMLATGGTAAATVSFLKKRGCNNVKFLCLIAAPEGVARLQKEHPDTDIFAGALDLYLNDHGYIVPGLGDAGDRLFGTK
ncbi:MAG: uracil phosphoribosyltransferase [Oscillospiraceae bacterium]|jgi:uracil phosphoribosyltransferase|nr:uracil phosphoribosyltransferase [Oscillospiraceae bacterium]